MITHEESAISSHVSKEEANKVRDFRVRNEYFIVFGSGSWNDWVETE